MHTTLHFTSVGIALLDVLMLWSCWAVDKHLRLEAWEEN